LEAAINAQKDEVLNLGQDIRTYYELKHNVEVERELFLNVSKRLAETTVTESFATNNVKTVEPALVPDQPLPALKVPKLLLSLFLSLGCGAGLALIAERRDKRLRDFAEVEKYLNLPFLGLIPHYKIERGKQYKLVTLLEPVSLAAESYRMIRTLLQSSPQVLQTLLITSVAPGEGKSTTAANLAISFAQLGKTVLVVDADLRHPSLHRLFATTGTVGLADMLFSDTDWRAGLQATCMENLHVIPAGVRPPNPSELLSSRRMQALLKSWKECFDIIICDSPIISGIPDVATVAPAMDGVLMVHHPAVGDKEVLLEATRLLARVGARCIGMVFNNVKSRDNKWYSPRYSYYAPAAAPTPLSQWSHTDHIDMRPVESRRQWQIEPVRGPGSTVAPPVELGKSAQSTGLTITLNSFLLQRRLNGVRSANGFCFLTLDLEMYNSAEQPHIFDPALTAITAGRTNDYSQALAAQLSLPSLDHAATSPPLQAMVCHWDSQTQTIEKGLVAPEPLAPKHLKRGRLVYQVPEEVTYYVFGYEHDSVRIAISIMN
jgi:capsular exopolysaccharide synthesis family protein